MAYQQQPQGYPQPAYGGGYPQQPQGYPQQGFDPNYPQQGYPPQGYPPPQQQPYYAPQQQAPPQDQKSGGDKGCLASWYVTIFLCKVGTMLMQAPFFQSRRDVLLLLVRREL
ncbi:unnamed protein product [Penicillium glandicola]